MFDARTACVVVVGAQWGDEGKGKLVDVLAERADLVVRYQGGANAGHTVVIGETQFILRQIPSGILHPGVTCVVGNGVVLEPETFFGELDQLVERGISTAGRIFVSDRAHLVLPYHKLLDAASEKSQKLGTTGRGIGPAYEDKIARRAIRVGDLFAPQALESKLERLLDLHNFLLANYYRAERVDPRRELDNLLRLGERVKPLVVDVTDHNDRAWLDAAGNFHSEQLKLTERYSMRDANTIDYEVTIADPKVFTRPWKISMPLYRRVEPNAQLMQFKRVEFVEELMYGDLRKKPTQPAPPKEKE